jgi:hypothetical protein
VQHFGALQYNSNIYTYVQYSRAWHAWVVMDAHCGC